MKKVHLPAIMEVVPEARLELARVSTKVFETSASAIPPFGHRALLCEALLGIVTQVTGFHKQIEEHLLR